MPGLKLTVTTGKIKACVLRHTVSHADSPQPLWWSTVHLCSLKTCFVTKVKSNYV